LVYTAIAQMHDDYRNDVVCLMRPSALVFAAILTNLPQLTPQLLKPAVSKALNAILAPIQAAYQASSEWQEIALKAYPPPAKREKKVKDKGSRHPGHLAQKTTEKATEKTTELPVRPAEN
jgi:tyrosyl-tRNA synthetase